MRLSNVWNALIRAYQPTLSRRGTGRQWLCTEIGNEVLEYFWNCLESRKVLSPFASGHAPYSDCASMSTCCIGVYRAGKLLHVLSSSNTFRNSWLSIAVLPLSPVLSNKGSFGMIVVGLEAVMPGVCGIQLPLEQAPCPSCPHAVRCYLHVKPEN